MSPTASTIPIRQALFDGGGTPQGQALVQSLGNMSRGWVIYLQGRNSPVSINDATSLTSVGPTQITGNSPTQEGTLNAVIIRQTVGGGLISWDTSVYQNAPVDIDTTAATESLFLFLAHNGFWLYLLSWTGQPLSA